MRMNDGKAADTPLVSVVVPVYNAARFLEKTVMSVLNQTYRNFELIMVDDGSPDQSLEILREFEKRDPRVRVIAYKPNQGAAHARNTGIEQAKGMYIALLDSDDVWKEDKLEKQVRLIESRGADIAYCSYGFIDENDSPMMRPFIVPEETNYKKMLTKCVFSCSTIMVKTDIFKAHPFKSVFYHEDFVLWMELMKNGYKAVGDAEVLAEYRQVSGSKSNDKRKSAKHRWTLYRKALGLGVIPSCIAFIGYTVNGIKKYYL